MPERKICKTYKAHTIDVDANDRIVVKEPRDIRGFLLRHKINGRNHNFIVECHSELGPRGNWQDESFFRVCDFATGLPIFNFFGTVAYVDMARKCATHHLDENGSRLVRDMKARIKQYGLKRINIKKPQG